MWADLTGAVVRDAAGRPQYGVAVIQDITARKQVEAALRASEERLRLITDRVAGLIAYVDRNERYRFVNAAYERRFGLPREQLLGRSIRDLRGPIYHHLQPYLARGLAGEAVTFENTYEATGHALALQVSYVPDVQLDGQVAGLYVLITDITAQKQAQAELARLNEQLRQREAALQEANATLEQRVAERTAALRQEMAERQRLERQAQQAAHFSLLGRLAAGVSHEIRNPLGAVFLNVDLLAEELAQPSPDSPQVVAETLVEVITSGKAGGLKKVEPLKAVDVVNCSKRFVCEPPTGGPAYHRSI